MQLRKCNKLIFIIVNVFQSCIGMLNYNHLKEIKKFVN
jgi:hypothetical protein